MGLMNRRDFIAAGASAALSAALPFGAGAQDPAFKKKIKKAFITGPDEDSFKRAKDNGFDGVQLGSWNHKPEGARKAREAAEKHGIRICSLIRAWVSLDSPKPEEVDKIVSSIETALLAAEGFGCADILLVPALSPKVAIPPAYEFEIEMDDVGIVKRVVKGDNEKYQPYIDAQNRATKSSWEVLKRVTPVAEKTNVVIALENVWNNLWVRPELFKKFIDGHKHPMVRAFFDCGNHVKYGIPPETWIRTLGPSIVEL